MESADILENHINLYFLRSQSQSFGIFTKLDFYTAGNPSWIQRGLDKYLQDSSADTENGKYVVNNVDPAKKLNESRCKFLHFFEGIPNYSKSKVQLLIDNCKDIDRKECSS